MTTKKKEVGKKAPARTKPHGSATAAAILGRATVKPGQKPGRRNGEFKVKAEWAKFYQRLLELREQLTRQMNGLAKESAQEMAGYSLHMADSGTDNFDRDFALSLLSQEQDALYEIDQALKRIELGTYGTCEMSGKLISRARLEAIPFARFTVECQSQLEKQNKASRVRQSVTSLFGLTDDEDKEGEGEEEAAPAQESKE